MLIAFLLPALQQAGAFSSSLRGGLKLYGARNTRVVEFDIAHDVQRLSSTLKKTKEQLVQCAYALVVISTYQLSTGSSRSVDIH